MDISCTPRRRLFSMLIIYYTCSCTPTSSFVSCCCRVLKSTLRELGFFVEVGSICFHPPLRQTFNCRLIILGENTICNTKLLKNERKKCTRPHKKFLDSHPLLAIASQPFPHPPTWGVMLLLNLEYHDQTLI